MINYDDTKKQDENTIKAKKSRDNRSSVSSRNGRIIHKKGGFKKLIYVPLAIFVLAFLGGASGYLVVEHFNGNPIISQASLDSSKDGNILKLASEENIARVAKDVSPSVVSIVTHTSSNSFRQGQAAGTGIIVSKDGYIMTNHHVIDGATDITVTTSSGDVYKKVKTIGRDPLNDVAFLKIENVDNLKPAKIGNSNTLRIGQSVVAIGNSLGQYHDTVTSGIISGLGRPVTAQSGTGDSESLTDLIQTDAAINPGNSGGPLVNLSGQVVGINTAVADANGIGFAIPISATKGVLKSVLNKGKVRKAYLGVRYINITPSLANTRNLSEKQGALVTSGSGAKDDPAVVKGSPADKAGLKSGDIITKINDQVVGRAGGVSSLISQFVPGDKISVTYERDGKTHTTDVKLGEYKAPTQTKKVSKGDASKSSNRSLPNYLLPFGF